MFNFNSKTLLLFTVKGEKFMVLIGYGPHFMCIYGYIFGRIWKTSLRNVYKNVCVHCVFRVHFRDVRPDCGGFLCKININTGY